MAIEDVIWAKNRNMFGGIEPPNIVDFKVALGSDSTTVSITGKVLTKTVLNDSGALLSTTKGVMIRKKSTGYPKDEFDGELVVDKQLNTSASIYSLSVSDVIAKGEPTYYAAFPYSERGVYNRGVKNRATVNVSVIPNARYFFGYDLDTANSDPYARVSYPSDVDNASYTPAVLNDLQSWNITPGTKFMPRPCMLKYDGTVGEYLDSNDYTKTVEGTASNVANTDYEGNAMMEWPKIYTKRWEENGIYHFRCSDVKIDEDYECWCNYNADGIETSNFYIAIYPSGYSNVGAKELRSYSGISGGGLPNIDTYSVKTGWSKYENAVDVFLIQDLLVMMAKTTNLAPIFGYSHNTDGSTTYGITNYYAGYGNTLGVFQYKENVFPASKGSLSKIFGMEHYWSDKSRCVPQLRTSMSLMTVSGLKGSEDYITAYDLGITNAATYSGAISKMKTYPWGRLPYTFNGSSSTYECSICRIEYSRSNYRYAYFKYGYTLAMNNSDYSTDNLYTSRLTYR